MSVGNVGLSSSPLPVVKMRKHCPLILAMLLAVGRPGAAAEDPPQKNDGPQPVAYAKARLLCQLANQKIDESSGLACSRRKDGVFWTHNDSGGGPRIYAFNTKGEDLGTFDVAGAKAQDWEDMASFRVGRKCYLILADVGDNAARRKSCTLYIVEEPVLFRKKPVTVRIKVAMTIQFSYEDGPHDCEAVAVDAKNRMIYLVSKVAGLTCKVYELPISKGRARGSVIARPVATLKVPVTTGMDMSADGTRCVVLTYLSAYEFTRKPGETWKDAFSRRPRTLAMPLRRQGESISYGADGKTLYLTSEKVPTPLWEIPVQEAK